MSLKFAEDEKVICIDGEQFYVARIIKGEVWSDNDTPGPHYFLHYLGWKSSWDEWVPEDRILKHTNENLEREKKRVAMAKKKKKNEKQPEKQYGNMESEKSVKKETSLKSSSKASGSIVSRSISPLKQKKPSNPQEIVKIPMPDGLKVCLVEDWEAIFNENQVIALPKKPNVEEIIFDYKESRSKTLLKEKRTDVGEGLRNYFNKALGTILLYPSERKQYEDLMDQNPGILPAKLYGAEHLLRLFVKLPELIAGLSMNSSAKGYLRDCLADFLMFLERGKDRYLYTKRLKLKENGEMDWSTLQEPQRPRPKSPTPQSSTHQTPKPKEIEYLTRSKRRSLPIPAQKNDIAPITRHSSLSPFVGSKKKRQEPLQISTEIEKDLFSWSTTNSPESSFGGSITSSNVTSPHELPISTTARSETQDSTYNSLSSPTTPSSLSGSSYSGSKRINSSEDLSESPGRKKRKVPDRPTNIVSENPDDEF